MIGNGISPLKYRSVGPVSVLQPWYDSLSVKPSAGLWADLKTMATSLVTAGKWSEFDFFSLIAAMETDEQRLRPLKTTSGLDITTVASPTLNVNGVTGNRTTSYVDFNFNLAVNAIKYTLNNAAFGFCRSTIGTNARRAMGISVSTISTTTLSSGSTTLSASLNINNTALSLSSGAIGYTSMQRVSSSTVNVKTNGSILNRPLGVTSIPNGKNLGCCFASYNSSNVFLSASALDDATYRMFWYGSDVIENDDNFRTIMNTFFAARGLTTF